MISTSRQSASRAIVPAIRKGFLNYRPTQTCLRRAARVNLDELSTGAFCLVRKHSEKTSPSCIVNRLRQHPASKPLHVQVLYGNRAVLIDEVARELVVEVRPLISDVGMSPLQLEHGLAAAVTPLLSPGYLTLAAPEPDLSIPVVARVLDRRAVGQDGETRQANVDADRMFASRKRGGFPFGAEAREPVASFPFDRDRLNFAFQRPMQFELDVARPVDAEFAAVEQSTAVSVGREGDTVVAPEGSKPREPRLVAALTTGEERLEGPVDAPQNVLAAGEVRERQAPIGPHRLQLVSLIVVADRLAARLPGPNPLLQGGVVERARFTQFSGEEVGLRLRGVEPVFVGQPHFKKHLRASLVAESQPLGPHPGLCRAWPKEHPSGVLPLGLCERWFAALPYVLIIPRKVVHNKKGF